MCGTCGHLFCSEGCPEYSPGRREYICYQCGADIYSGEEYYKISGEEFCSDCIYLAKAIAGEY